MSHQLASERLVAHLQGVRITQPAGADSSSSSRISSGSPVLALRRGNEPEIIRKARAARQHLAQLEDPEIVVEGVFVAAALRRFDDRSRVSAFRIERGQVSNRIFHVVHQLVLHKHQTSHRANEQCDVFILAGAKKPRAGARG
jgi:hypothetical protein